MAKENPLTATESEEKRLKKEKKEKKRSETDGIHKKKDKSERKKDKSEKKKKDRSPAEPLASADKTVDDAPPAVTADAAEDVHMTTQLLDTLEKEKPGTVAVKEDGDVETIVKNVDKPLLVGALVPFANPLADEKVGRKVLKGVKKASKNKTLKRGVKEVVKSLRKSPLTTTSTSSDSLPTAIVILAADISPMDVISHLPVLCEDHGIPYVFVTSRAELGAASSTKRPTSVVMIARDKGKGGGGGGGGKEKGGKDEEKEKGEGEAKEEGWEEVYKDLVKVVVKAGRGVRI
ncbi:MAG: hypothetical protein Q9219_000812 [cf. Caloplaca sp. 3 TL-2023]